jgi:hypothetical protein
VPARDFEISKRFYMDLGFTPMELIERLIETRLGEFRFFAAGLLCEGMARELRNPFARYRSETMVGFNPQRLAGSVLGVLESWTWVPG